MKILNRVLLLTTILAVFFAFSSNIQIAEGDTSLSNKFECAGDGLLLTHIGPKQATKDIPVQYGLEVVNPTGCEAWLVKATTVIPEQAEFVEASNNGQYDPNSRAIQWSLDKLQAGESHLFQYQIKLASPGIFKNCSFASAQFAKCFQFEVVEPVISCMVSAPKLSRSNEEFEVCVEVFNSGNGKAADFNVTVILSNGLTFSDTGEERKLWENLSLEPNQSLRNCWKVVAKEDGIGNIQTEIQVAEGIQATSCEAAIEIATPELTIEKNGPPMARINSNFRYSIVVTNSGQAKNTNVVLIDKLPAGVKFMEASDGGKYKYRKGIVQWLLGDLDVGESRKVFVKVKGLQEKSSPGWENRAGVRSNEVSSRFANAFTIIEALPAMHIASFDTEDPAQLGDTTTYIVTIRNEGQKRATGVQFTFNVPEEGEYVSFTTRKREVNGEYDSASRSVVFEEIPVMEPDDEVIFEITVKAELEGSAIGTGILKFNEFAKPFQVQEPTTYYK